MRRSGYQREIEKNRARVYEESIQRRFDLSLSDYEGLLEEQGGLCAICGEKETGRDKDGTPRRLQIDHDHSSGQVRSLLCSGCNVGLAGFKEDRKRMGKAIEYVKTKRKSSG